MRMTMKKLFTISLIGSALALSACANNGSEGSYAYEQNAPYASERTVGNESAQAQTQRGDTMYRNKQVK